ncbi:Hypothetical protein A7982_07953 [Minicystis rosea]|nr:Hypothetical protein A7982_07953 [Minicystis rosea]
MSTDGELQEVVVNAVRYATHQAFARRAAHLEADAVDVALLAVAKAHGRYRADEGTFAGFAYWHYRGAVERFIKKERRRAFEELPYHDVVTWGGNTKEGGDAMDTLLGLAERCADESIDELLASDLGCPEPVFLRREHQARVARRLSSLSASDQKLLQLRFAEDLTWTAIAEELGLAAHVVRYRVETLCRDLRAALEEGELAQRRATKKRKK